MDIHQPRRAKLKANELLLMAEQLSLFLQNFRESGTGAEKYMDTLVCFDLDRVGCDASMLMMLVVQKSVANRESRTITIELDDLVEAPALSDVSLSDVDPERKNICDVVVHEGHRALHKG